MKNLYLLFAFVVFGLFQLQAQCPVNATVIECGTTTPVDFPPSGASSADCVVASGCGTLANEYLIVNVPPDTLNPGPMDTVIVQTSTTTSFDPAPLEGTCVTVQPMCYDLGGVQAFVDDLNGSFFDLCCIGVNDFGNNNGYGPICDQITAVYSSGSQVQDLTDVFFILALFGGDTLTVQGLAAVIDGINAEVPALSSVCPNVSAIGYCFEQDVDFTQRAYSICPPPPPCVVEPFVNLTGGMTSTADEIAQDSIHSDHTVPSPATVAYRAGISILLNAGFTVELGADFTAEIIADPCAAAAQPETPQEEQK